MMVVRKTRVASRPKFGASVVSKSRCDEMRLDDMTARVVGGGRPDVASKSTRDVVFRGNSGALSAMKKAATGELCRNVVTRGISWRVIAVVPRGSDIIIEGTSITVGVAKYASRPDSAMRRARIIRGEMARSQ